MKLESILCSLRTNTCIWGKHYHSLIGMLTRVSIPKIHAVTSSMPSQDPLQISYTTYPILVRPCS